MMPWVHGGFMWLMWPLLFLLFFGLRRRRWDRRWEQDRAPREDPQFRQELEEQRSYIDALEERLAEVETKLDFTERLLSGRRDAPAGAQ